MSQSSSELSRNELPTPEGFQEVKAVRVVVEAGWIRWGYETCIDELNIFRWRYTAVITKVKIDDRITDVDIPMDEFNKLCKPASIVYGLSPIMTYECSEEITKYLKLE